jgi:Flp pilus assembly pilin Flp
MKQVQQVLSSACNRASWFSQLSKDERGASFTEYAVLVGLVAIAGIAGYTVFGEAINETVESFAETVKSLGGG